MEQEERMIISGLYGVHGGTEMKERRERVKSLIINRYGIQKNNKNLNVNKIKTFKDIPDGIEILIDYVDVTALRTMYIPIEIIYESIYRELPELFEEEYENKEEDNKEDK